MLDKIIYILTLLFLTISCKSQNITHKKKSVGITKGTDTILCPFVDNYSLNYIRITSENTKIENKVNSYILSNGETLSHKNNFDFLLKKTKDSIKEICTKEEKIELVEHNYEINYNDDSILSITHNWVAYGYTMSNNAYYNFNLKNGDIINIDSILNINKKDIIFKKVKDKITFLLKNELEDYKKDETKEFYDNFKENLLSYKKEYQIHDLENFIFLIDEKQKGIEFKFSYEYPQVVKAYEPVFQLFFSFKELEPYLNEDFKKQIRF